MNSLLFITLLVAVAAAAEDQFCTPGLTFEMDCNTCTCSDDGKTAACTDMLCPNKEQEIVSPSVSETESKLVCEPRSQFKDYCNTCFCANDGSSYACTRMMCDKEIWNQDGTLKIVYESHRLTRSVPNQVCKPRSQFKDYCNTCTCADDGSSFACTRMMCDKEIWNRDGTFKQSLKFHRVSRSISSQVCKPNSHFKEYCNSCVCSKDGLFAYCTLMFCDRRIYNKDGSRKVDILTAK